MIIDLTQLKHKIIYVSNNESTPKSKVSLPSDEYHTYLLEMALRSNEGVQALLDVFSSSMEDKVSSNLLSHMRSKILSHYYACLAVGREGQRKYISNLAKFLANPTVEPLFDGNLPELYICRHNDFDNPSEISQSAKMSALHSFFTSGRYLPYAMYGEIK